MNILLTCSGRRNYLVDYFKQAIDGAGKVYTVNSTPEATSMLVSDGAFVAPPLYEDDYIDYLLKICHDFDIKLLVSLFDLELPILAEHRSRFEKLGVAMAVSSSKVIAICNDKLKTMEFGKEIGLPTLFTTCNLQEAVHSIKKGKIDFPVFIKPRWGMGSIALQHAETIDELRVLYQKVKRDLEASYLKHYPSFEQEASVIIQEKAPGQEYGLDIINDLQGNYVTTFVKRKLAMRSGETDGSVTEDVPQLYELGQIIGTKLGHVGNLDVDIFWDGKMSTILEMNARLGGGYPFSHLAGANIPKAYIDWAKGDKAQDKDLKVSIGTKGFKSLNLLNSSCINLIETNE